MRKNVNVPVIAVIALKGGVGKSTYCQTVAQILDMLDEKVLYVNLDSDQDYRANYLPDSISFITLKDYEDLIIDDLIEEYKASYVIIDSGGFHDHRLLQKDLIDILVVPTNTEQGSIDIFPKFYENYKEIIEQIGVNILLNGVLDIKDTKSAASRLMKYTKECGLERNTDYTINAIKNSRTPKTISSESGILKDMKKSFGWYQQKVYINSILEHFIKVFTRATETNKNLLIIGTFNQSLEKNDLIDLDTILENKNNK